MPDRSSRARIRNPQTIRLLVDTNRRFSLVPDDTGGTCGNNAIICTGMSEELLIAAQFPFLLVSMLSERDNSDGYNPVTGQFDIETIDGFKHYWPFDTPSWEQVKQAWWLLFGTVQL